MVKKRKNMAMWITHYFYLYNVLPGTYYSAEDIFLCDD